jgi:sulfoxide reductase heme-binding subunit YedZ
MQAWTLKNIIKAYGRYAIYLFCVFPFLRLLGLGFTDSLTANPIEFITRFTGTWAIVFLCCTLAVTPIRKITKMNYLVLYRRPLGIGCFIYALLHFLTWLVLDHQLEFSEIIPDFYKRTYITVGLAAFLLLIPLAATSTHHMQRILGRKWQKLHQLIYLIAILAPLHYWLHKAAKNNLFTVKIYVGVIAILLGYRFINWLKRKNGLSWLNIRNP